MLVHDFFTQTHKGIAKTIKEEQKMYENQNYTLKSIKKIK